MPGATNMQGILAAQKAAHIRDGLPSYDKRVDWMNGTIALLVDHKDELCEAVTKDFGHRSKDQTGLTDILAGISALKFAKKTLKSGCAQRKGASNFQRASSAQKRQFNISPKGSSAVSVPGTSLLD